MVDIKFYTNVFQRGNKIYVRGYKNGQRYQEEVEYHPYLFVNSGKEATTNYHTIDGHAVDKIEFGSIYEAKDFIKRYDDVSNFPIYGLRNFQYTYIYDNFHGEIQYDTSLINVIGIDIETDTSTGYGNVLTADKEVISITLSRKNRERLVFSLKPYNPPSKKTTHILCDDEYDLLTKFLHTWQSGRWLPDVITGWNIEFYDIPYLVNRITNIMGKKEASKLSPWGILVEQTIEIYGKEQQAFVPAGVNVIDYLPLYKKFSFKNHENFKLDTIAEAVLKVKKINYSEYGSLDGLYQQNPQLFFEYNERDVELIDMLEERLKFIELVMAFAYDAKINYIDTFTTVRPWDVIIHNYLMDRAVVIPPMRHFDMPKELVGGYVKEPKIGKSKWVVSFDLNALYPNIMMGYNISPETLVDTEENFHTIQNLLDNKFSYSDEAFCYAANGSKFRKDKHGFIAAILEKTSQDRVSYKDKMIEFKKELENTTKDNVADIKRLTNSVSKYHNLQLAAKIKNNSLYGMLANVYGRWFNFYMAEAITTTGQLTIQWIEKYINEYLNKLLKTENIDYIIASDTDSLYINMNPLVSKFFPEEGSDEQKITDALDTFCSNNIQKVINRACDDLAVYLNAYENKMKMKRETIASAAVWKAKKKYAMYALDIEGVRFTTPELKIQGLEAIRSSTPKICQKPIKDTIKMILIGSEKEAQDFIMDFKSEFMKMAFSDIATPSGVNGLEEYFDISTVYKKGCPMGVKAALIYNNLLKKQNLETKYQRISSGDKIRYAYLMEPNPIHMTVIGCPDDLPKEFDLHRYIDYNRQFEKSFLKPVSELLGLVGWQAEKHGSLLSFF